MAKITKENILENYKNLSAEYKTLRNKTYEPEIKTGVSMVGGMLIKNMNMTFISGLYINVKEYFDTQDSMVQELGIKKENEAKFEGYTREQWINSLKTRVQEIQDTERLNQIESVLPTLEKNLSADDKFSLDMEDVESKL